LAQVRVSGFSFVVGGRVRAFIIANGQAGDGERYAALMRPGDLVIAADGGAALALQMGIQPQVVIGDMDSLPAELRGKLEALGCQFVCHPERKDETDTELAIRYALQRDAQELVLLGATGSRLDHTLANVFLLALPELRGKNARIVAGSSEVWLLRDSLELKGKPGDIVTLLPLGQDAIGVDSEGLEYALRGDALRFGLARGVSNIMTSTRARISLRQGLLLVFHLSKGEQNIPGGHR
jgi:thiamine pyrophosphokinase